MHHYALPEDFFNGLISSMVATGHPRSRCCCPARVNAACNLLRKSVGTELVINPGDQIGAAHTAVMARHLLSFSGPQSAGRARQPDLELPWSSSRETLVRFGQGIRQFPDNSRPCAQIIPKTAHDGDSEACAACQNLPKQSHEAALSQGTRKTGALPASPALSCSAITLIAPIWEA